MFIAEQEIGPYALIKRIGRGAFGEVWLAERRAKFVTTKVAVKLPLEEQIDTEAIKNEAVVWEQASGHPNVLPIIEADEYDGQVVIVSEYAPDGSLHGYLETHGALSVRKALELTIGILSGLEFLHSKSIIHRDIKPANILLQGETPRLADFGVSRVIKTNSVSVSFGGTPSYMAPEAFEKKRNVHTDLWSVGVMLYEMLNGRLPFPQDNLPDLFGALMREDPKPPEGSVPPRLSEIVARSLQRSPEQRYQSAREMRDLLTDFLVGIHQRRMEETIANDPWPSITIDNLPAPEVRTTTDGSVPFQSTAGAPSTISEPPGQILPPTNLTEYPVSIIGREKEISEICELLLREDVRLVTMTGIGGTGKTTLSQASANRLLPKFADGVFFVELDAITNLELVATTIAEPLGVKEAGAKPIIEILCEYLSDKQILLVLDNFEQITDAAPQIGELVSAGSGIKILVTSRIPLHLSSEREYIVPPLSVPRDISQITLDELSNYEAIKLFVNRSQRAKNNFELTNENAKSITEICTRLDGLPLAIELAAARVKILSPQAILTKLESRLHLLTGGSTDLPDRQQTMHGSIEWSYELLTREERQLFRHLSVFAGGFTVDAAETVCRKQTTESGVDQSVNVSIDMRSISDDSPVLRTINRLLPTDFDILDGITSLVDKSLLVAHDQSDGEVRFRMLEVVREYALDALLASDKAEAMFRSHAEYFLALGEEAEPHLRTERSAEWLARLEDEDDNLRAALGWLLLNEPAMAARLAAAIRYFWFRHDHLIEGRKWMKAVLDRGPLDVPPSVRFNLLNGLGLAARLQGDYETAKKAHEEGLEAGKAENDGPQIASSSRGLGTVAIKQGDLETARKYLDDGLAISQMADDKFGTVVSLSMLGDLAQLEAKYSEARSHFEASLAISRELNDKWFVTSTVNNLGFVSYNEGDHRSARSYFEEALTIAQELGNKIAISYSLDGFAAIAVKRGAAERASRLSGAAQQLRDAMGSEIEPAERLVRDAYLAHLKTQIDEAAFIQAYEQGRRLKLEDAVALCMEEKKE